MSNMNMRPQSAVGPQKVVPPLNLNVLPEQVGSARSRRSSTRPATASHTSRSSIARASIAESNDATTLRRNAIAYFDTFQKDDLKETIAQTTASWLLSTDFRGAIAPLNGMMSNLKLSQDPHITILIPKKEDVPALEYRELHQIVRDLTVGIFALNQMPSLSFEPNFDSSTSCQLPLAYKNTTVGQILISLDYKMKSLWHGATVPHKKRAALAERWRALVDMNKATGQANKTNNALQEFTIAGQYYLNKDEQFATIYEELNEIDPNEFVAKRENEFFNSYAEFFRCMLNFHITSVTASSESNVVLFECDYDVESQIIAPEEKIEASSQQRLRRRLRSQMEVICKGIKIDPATRREIELVKLIAFLSPLLAAMRRRMMRIPDVDSMLSRISGEGIQTHSQIPPFAFGEDKGRPCLTFSGPAISHTHGGISFDIETPEVKIFSDEEKCKEIATNASEHLRKLFEDEMKRQQYIVPTISLDDEEYYMLHIPLTTYYSASPPQPGWLHSMYQELATLRPKRLPMSDLQILELFKQTFGFKKAFANKSVEAGLKLCACRGLTAPFASLMRKVNTNALFSPDLQGFSLVHYAAMYNHPNILSLLFKQRLAVNERRTAVKVKSEKRSSASTSSQDLDERTGLSLLHYAARCGSTECCTLLLGCKANVMLSDGHGWSAVHHAAHCGHVSVLRILLRKKASLLELPATGNDCATPLLIAASGGSVNCVDFLIKLGARHDVTDSLGNTAVHRAALNFHTPVLEYFIKMLSSDLRERKLSVWDILVEMLLSASIQRQDASLRCLEMLLHRTPAYWCHLLEAGAVPPLVELLNSEKIFKASGNAVTSPNDTVAPIRSLACSVICLMSENDKVRREIASAGAMTTLIDLLSPNGESVSSIICELQSRSSVVLSDLACVDDNAAKIAKHGGILPLVKLLQVDIVDVLVNAVNTLQALCQSDKEGDNQRQVVECGAVEPLVEFLFVREEVLPSATAAAVAEICRHNREIQDIFLDAGVLKPLVLMLRGRNFNAKVQAAKAVESLCEDNEEAQQLAEKEHVADAICTMFQAMAEPVKEKGARAIWALAGEHPEQQRRIAKRIGLRQIKDMLSSKSQTLQLVGCHAVAATAYMSSSGQQELAEYDDMMENLIRLLRLDSTTRPVVSAVIHAISNLCVGVAHQNNKFVQEFISESGAIEVLAQRVWECTHDECLQVELLHCLACTVVGCQHNEEQLHQLDTFGLEIVLELLNSFNQIVRQRAAMTLATFAFNRPQQQKNILKMGGLTVLIFEDLLTSHNHEVRAEAAFQMVVLAKAIVDSTLVEVSARGILVLVQLLESNNNRVLIVTAQCITSLSHTRAGVSDALVTTGAVAKLLRLIFSSHDIVRMSSAQALGYLSYNRVASRELISACRSNDGLYEAIIRNLGEDAKISEEFVAEYKRQCAVGLPIAKKRPPSASVPRTSKDAAFQSQDHYNKPRSRRHGNRRERNGTSLRSRSLSPVVLVTESPRS